MAFCVTFHALQSRRNDEGEVVYPNLEHVRFHDGRHTAITTLCEKGVPDWVIQAQVGHVDAEMMKTYSHIRRHWTSQALRCSQTSRNKPPRLVN